MTAAICGCLGWATAVWFGDLRLLSEARQTTVGRTIEQRRRATAGTNGEPCVWKGKNKNVDKEERVTRRHRMAMTVLMCAVVCVRVCEWTPGVDIGRKKKTD